LVKPTLLADVLYSGQWSALVAESEWIDLVQAISLGNEGSFRALVERMHPWVFTLSFRIVGERRGAEEATVDTFWDIWTRVAKYKLEKGTVVAWIMNQARHNALRKLAPGSRTPQAMRSRPLPAMDAVFETLWATLAQRIDRGARGVAQASQGIADVQWREVAPGITCKLLANDAKAHQVSMLVRLVPGGEYPPHTHAGLEELHLLEGELWIDERKLFPGDYNRAEAPSGDKRVWSETGCMCVLITSTKDELAS
jgi:quercetin dioxygenase-like cupin family protein